LLITINKCLINVYLFEFKNLIILLTKNINFRRIAIPFFMEYPSLKKADAREIAFNFSLIILSLSAHA